LIIFPPGNDKALEGRLVGNLSKLSKVSAECALSKEAGPSWESYQHENRRLLRDGTDEAQLSRLNGAPNHVLKLAMLFEASRWAVRDEEVWDGVIQRETLEVGIRHVDGCLLAGTLLDTLSNKARIQSDADVLLAKVRCDIYDPAPQRGWILIDKTKLTSKYAHHSSRPGSWTPDDLYLRLIPNLMKRGLAKLVEHSGKRVVYAFRVED
jgi:hypothetical protein